MIRKIPKTCSTTTILLESRRCRISVTVSAATYNQPKTVLLIVSEITHSKVSTFIHIVPITHRDAYIIKLYQITYVQQGRHACYSLCHSVQYTHFCRLCTVINEQKRSLRTPVELRSVSRQEQVRDSSFSASKITPRV